jgi:hypothetical protein
VCRSLGGKQKVLSCRAFFSFLFLQIFELRFSKRFPKVSSKSPVQLKIWSPESLCSKKASCGKGGQRRRDVCLPQQVSQQGQSLQSTVIVVGQDKHRHSTSNEEKQQLAFRLEEVVVMEESKEKQVHVIAFFFLLSPSVPAKQ